VLRRDGRGVGIKGMELAIEDAGVAAVWDFAAQKGKDVLVEGKALVIGGELVDRVFHRQDEHSVGEATDVDLAAAGSGGQVGLHLPRQGLGEVPQGVIDVAIYFVVRPTVVAGVLVFEVSSDSCPHV